MSYSMGTVSKGTIKSAGPANHVGSTGLFQRKWQGRTSSASDWKIFPNYVGYTRTLLLMWNESIATQAMTA